MNSDIKFYLKLLIKRLPVMLTLVAIGCTIGLGLALTVPPTYRAEARLLVESAQIPNQMVISTVQTSADKQLQIIEERLMTRANMIETANKFGVFDARDDLTPDEIARGMETLTSIQLAQGDSRRATVMEIAFLSEDPQVAADVVNEFVTLVESESAEIRQEEATETAEFFESEVARLSAELSQKSAAIVAFQEANKDALPGEQQYRLTRQSQLQERLNIMSREIVTQQEQRNRLVALGTTGGNQQVTLSAEQQQLANLRNQLSSALSVYSESNPRVRMLRAQIKQLEETIAPNSGSDTTVDPLQTVLKVQLSDIDSRIRFLKEDSKAAEAELEALRIAIEKSPENAIRLAALDRDYRNIQNQYNQAVSSLATAKVGESVEVQGKGEKVTVIERAFTPSNPSGPNRRLIAGGGAFAGTALAVLFFVVTELLNRAIRRPIDLTRGLGIQPLATIPYIEPANVVRRRRFAQIAMLLMIVIAVPFALWALHTYVLPLDLIAEKAMRVLGR